MSELKQPSEMVGWYSAPNLRGTLELVWSCAFTIFVCTWTANRLNVPPYGSSAAWRFFYKLKIMMLSLLTPEYIAAIAVTELRTSIALTSRMRALGYEHWTNQQSFFVLMGGYMIHYDDVWTPLDTDAFFELLEHDLIQLESPQLKAKSGPPKRSKSKTLKKTNTVTIEKPTTTSSQMSLTSTPTLPWVTALEINDRSKADWMLKAVACAQLGWLTIQCIGRAAQNISLSTLEATTLAYISSALFAYAAWWNKPYDLQSPIVVTVAGDDPIIDRIKNLSPFIPFDEEPELEVDQRTYMAYICGTFTVLGVYSGLHLLAWNVHFGSAIEQQLWRWLTISLLGLHVILFTAALCIQTRASSSKVRGACIATWQWLAESLLGPIVPKSIRPAFRSLHVLDCLEEDKLVAWPLRLPILVLTLQYVFTSAYLILESFVGLRQMPMMIYMTVDWVQFLPHIN